MYISSMLKTAKQIANSVGKVESLALKAIKVLHIEPDALKPHAGSIARYYGDKSQERIISYISLSRSAKRSMNPPCKRVAAPRPPTPREKWTYWYLSRKVSISIRGVTTLLRLHDFPTMESFIKSSCTLEDVIKWHQDLPGDTPYLKGRALFKLGRQAAYYSKVSSAKIRSAQQRIIEKHDLSLWATREQAAEYLGYNDTTTYALYKAAGLRFLKDHAVRLYYWEDLKTLKASLLAKKNNSSNLAEIVKARLLQEGLDFTAEKTFPDLINISPLRIDYCIPSLRVLIEVQGAQHFTEGFKGMTSEISLEVIQQRDIAKIEYAKKNGWDLIWITYPEDIGDALSYLKGPSIGSEIEWSSELIEDYGLAALSHYDGNASRFCWLHRGHFPYHRAGMVLKRIHKSYWSAAVGPLKSPYAAWSTKKAVFKRLVENRLKYHPSLNALGAAGLPTLSMLVAGFGVAKINPPVSFFAPSFGVKLIQKLVSEPLIVDPFSGFSGRALASHLTGKKYCGFDVSPIRVSESQEVLAYYNMQNITVEQADASQSSFKEWRHAALLTCPPYGDKESWDGIVGYENEDYWVTQALLRHGCNKYIFIVGSTKDYASYEIKWEFSKSHSFFSQGSRKVLIFSREDRDRIINAKGLICV